MTRIPTLPADAVADEDTRLLLSSTTTSGNIATRVITAVSRPGICTVCRRNKRHILLYVGTLLLVVIGFLTIPPDGPISNDLLVKSIILGKHKKKNKQTKKIINKAAVEDEDDNDDDDTFMGVHINNDTSYPKAEKRCEWVIAQFQQRDADKSESELREQYASQDGSVNIFYRATANIFWRDFKDKGWGNFLIATLDKVSLAGGVPVVHKNTWTWVTGDQHLSNFGAWMNRAGEVVFGVNDFDEAAIYDFQIDILRIAVSICNHAKTNGFSEKTVKRILHTFTNSYIDTVVGYVGNEKAILFELTPKTTYGKLKKFLKKVENDNSNGRQLEKFTKRDKSSGNRVFLKGDYLGTPDPYTRLSSVSPKNHKMIVDAFTRTKYGATMMKLGWQVKEWSDDFFTVLDVAQRVGSGVGSFGVDRFYVLIKGTDKLLGKGRHDGAAVIFDVKLEPNGAVRQVLTEDEQAWYDVRFPNAAARAVEAQRRLTSYTDPYLGWIMLEDDNGVAHPFYIRQRSPWKHEFDIDKLTDPDHFSDFVVQIAIATATSHTRGSEAKAPGDFKDVIKSILGHKFNRQHWGDAVANLALAYREQVLFDFQCFQGYVEEYYPPSQQTDEEIGDDDRNIPVIENDHYVRR